MNLDEHLSKKEVIRFFEENGIPGPEKRLIKLFFESEEDLKSAKNFLFKLPREKAISIIKEGRLSELAAEYYKAKQKLDMHGKETIWEQAKRFILGSPDYKLIALTQ